MGMSYILSLIAGISMTVILGSQVAPSMIEGMKIKKVENRTISNQEMIKVSIERYIKANKKIPKDVQALATDGFISPQQMNNGFMNDGYTFVIDKAKGTLKIRTTISDVGATKYFTNGYKFNVAPVQIGTTNVYETFYLLDNEAFKSLPPPEVGSAEHIESEFVADNIGKRFEESTLIGGEKDYVVVIDPSTGTGEVTEHTYDKGNEVWVPGTTTGGMGVGKETGVEIKDIEWEFTNGLGELVKQKHEKVICNANSINKEVFVINENTKLGEIIWVAPNSVSAIKTKLSGFTSWSSGGGDTRNGKILKFIPNNICVSNVTNMNNMFQSASAFNQPLNSWDVSKVTNISYMFREVSVFNQPLNSWNVSSVTDMYYVFWEAKAFNLDISSWNVSKVTNMAHMFRNAKAFNQDISSWNVSKVTNMRSMFQNTNAFNQPLNSWNVSNVIAMEAMFGDASAFNQPLNSWNVSNVTDMAWMFYNASAFNQNLSSWCVSRFSSYPSDFDTGTTAWDKTNRQPKWGVTCP